MKLLARTAAIALFATAASSAHAAVSCEKDFDQVRAGNSQIDLTLSEEVKDNLTGWDANNDGMVSRSEYLEVCQNNPEDYKSIQNMSYFKKQKLRGE